MTNEPCDMEQIQEEYEEAALSLLVNHIMQKEGRDLLEKSDELFRDPDNDYPVDLDKRAAKIIDRHFSILRRRNVLSSFKKAVTHVSRVFLFVFLIFSLTFTKVSAFRDVTLSFIEKAFDRGTAITGSDLGIINNISTKVPRWLPEGRWELEFFSNNANASIAKYTRSDGSFINIDAVNSSSIYSIDTEDADIRHDIMIEGYPALLSIKDDRIILTWTNEDESTIYGITISGDSELISIDVVVRIAESLS